MQNSTKSVLDKLNFKKYPEKLILNIPEDVEEFKTIDYDTSIKKDNYDLIFVFIYKLEDFITVLQDVVEKQLVRNNGYVFFAYPKKGNKKYQEYIERDSIYTEEHYDEEGYYRGSSLKFARMVSFNDVFTVIGLKSQARKKTSSKSSQSVDDYTKHVEDIKQYLNKKEELLEIYNTLTPGYQKDWARYVYSAKRKETQEKRLLEMETVLADGYKTMDLYRRRTK